MCRRRLFTITLAVFCLFSSILIGCSGTLHRYQGDGSFEDLSDFNGPFYIRGYSIRMPEFDLGTPYQAEYRLENVPDMGKDCGVYLAIIPKDHRLISETKFFDGELRLELTDLKGKSVVNVSGRLGDYAWAQGGNAELYQLDKSFFKPDDKQEYRLRLSYSPDLRLEGMRGFVYLRSGGSK